MRMPAIGAKAFAPINNNWTTDFVPTPDTFYTSPDTRPALTTVEPVNTNTAVYTPAPTQGYDVEGHQRLANYAATSLENTAQNIDSQNAVISELFGSLAGNVS